MANNSFAEVSLGDISEFRNGKVISPEKYAPAGRNPVFGSNGKIARSDAVLDPQPTIVIGRVGMSDWPGEHHSNPLRLRLVCLAYISASTGMTFEVA